MGAEISKYMVVCREQNSGQNHNIIIGHVEYGCAANFRYLVSRYIHEGSKSKLNTGVTGAVRCCPVLSGAEYFVFRSAIEIYKH